MEQLLDGIQIKHLYYYYFIYADIVVTTLSPVQEKMVKMILVKIPRFILKIDFMNIPSYTIPLVQLC